MTYQVNKFYSVLVTLSLIKEKNSNFYKIRSLANYNQMFVPDRRNAGYKYRNCEQGAYDYRE